MADKKERRDFLKSKYEVLSTALNRIKEDEQRWVSVLLLIYGGILTYVLGCVDCYQFSCEFIIPFTLIISLYWIYHSTNLRVQYYRTIIKIQKIEKLYLLKKFYKKDLIRNRKGTKPFESKFAEVLLAIGFTLIVDFTCILRDEISIQCIGYNMLICCSILVVILKGGFLYLFWWVIDKIRIDELFKKQFN